MKATPRTRKSEPERRSDVIFAARHLFSKYGYEKVTTKMIADEAGISRALVYRYHASKHDILSDILRDLIGEWAIELQAFKFPSGSPTLRVLAYFERLYEFDIKDLELRRIAVQPSWNWGPEVESLFFVQMGEVFWPLYDHLDANDGIVLNEASRHAFWAIYTESLRHHITSVTEVDLPNTNRWIEIIEPQIELLVAGLQSKKADRSPHSIGSDKSL